MFKKLIRNYQINPRALLLYICIYIQEHNTLAWFDNVPTITGGSTEIEFTMEILLEKVQVTE